MFFKRFNLLLILLLILMNVRIVIEIFVFIFIFLFCLKSENNLKINVQMFEFRCNFHGIDSICTQIVYKDRIYKSRVRFLFVKRLKRLIFLCLKTF